MTHTVHLQLEDIDNTVLQRLCGALDSNLEALGKALDIQISRRFEHFTFMGELAHAGRRALLALAEAAEQGDLDDNAIRLAAVEAKTADEKHEEKHHDQQYYFRTKRGSIGGRTPRQNGYIRALLNHDVVFGRGPAGTGKTYLAVAKAVRAFEDGAIRRIILTRPAVEAGENLGFLPGTLNEKVDPYLRPLYDALSDMLGNERMQRYIADNTIEVAPLAYMRGRTLNDAYVILDEAQNTTPAQMKMFLTRIGFGSKVKMFLTRLGFNTRMVITGDVTQVDFSVHRSGLLQIEKVLGDVDDIAFVHLGSDDVVRHNLVGRIVSAYDAFTAAQQKHKTQNKTE